MRSGPRKEPWRGAAVPPPYSRVWHSPSVSAWGIDHSFSVPASRREEAAGYLGLGE